MTCRVPLPPGTCILRYATETFALAAEDLSLEVQLLQPQLSKADVMSILNGLGSLQETLATLQNSLSSLRLFLWVCHSLWGLERQKGGASWAEESLHFKPTSFKVLSHLCGTLRLFKEK